MNEQTHKDRISEMIDVIMQVARGDYSVQVELSGQNDDLDSLAMGINMMIDDLRDSRDVLVKEHEYGKKRVSEIVDVITEIASLNFEKKISVSDNNDVFDATATGLNMLAEELLSSTVSRSYLNSILNSMVDMLIVLSPEAKIVTINPATLQTLGYSENELLGHSVGMVCPNYEELFNMLTNQNPDQNRVVNTIEKSVITKDGKEVPALVSCAVMRDDEGNIKGVVSVIKDITKQKESEKERNELERKLHQAQKMEAVGQLAGGIAHDFNNLLGGISANADLLEMKTDPSLKQYGYVKKIKNATMKAANLIQQLLTFARKARVEMEPVDIHESINKTVSTLNDSSNNSIEIHKNLYPDSLRIMGDRFQVEKALYNLAINARDAMPQGGKLIFETEAVSLESNSLSDENDVVVPGEYARISIIDTGIGMDEETQKSVFEPFFTTKEVGKGTGLGLASVYGFIKQHKGYITVKAKKNQGSNFTIFLPLLTKEINSSGNGW